MSTFSVHLSFWHALFYLSKSQPLMAHHHLATFVWIEPHWFKVVAHCDWPALHKAANNVTAVAVERCQWQQLF